MSEIDWSKAPSDATHYGPDTLNHSEAWYKKEGGCLSYKLIGEGDEVSWMASARPSDDLIARTESFNPWTGAGLPPVGTVCEIQHESLGWTRCEIVAHKVMDSTGVTMAIAWIDANTLDQSQGIRFRPIRTQAQIEAEEREKAVRELSAIISSKIIDRSAAVAIYEAGYRKQGEDK